MPKQKMGIRVGKKKINSEASNTRESFKASNIGEISEEGILDLSAEAADDLKESLVAGPKEAQMVFEALKGRVAGLAFQPVGCRVVQAALRPSSCLSQGEKNALAAEMKGCVRRAMDSNNANYVVQVIIEYLPPPTVEWVAQELIPDLMTVACSQRGCRVVQRFREFFPEAHPLNIKVMQNVKELSLSPYGSHVMEHLLAHGTEQQKTLVAGVMYANPGAMVTSCGGRDVMVKALECCNETDKHRIACGIFEMPCLVAKVMLGKGGHQLVAAAFNIDVRPSWKQDMCDQVEAAETQLKSTELPGSGYEKKVANCRKEVGLTAKPPSQNVGY